MCRQIIPIMVNSKLTLFTNELPESNPMALNAASLWMKSNQSIHKLIPGRPWMLRKEKLNVKIFIPVRKSSMFFGK